MAAGLCHLHRHCGLGRGRASDWERSKVQIGVRTLEVGGVGGTRWDATSNWLSGSRSGDEITMVIDQHWPEKSARLVKDNEPDEFAVGFR